MSGNKQVFSAGGLLWKQTPEGKKLAVIYRTRHGSEWCLPKGKQDTGESLDQTALREVREETGCEARLIGFAGSIAYPIPEGQKVAMFWHMECISESEPKDDEAKGIVWLSPDDARLRLSHEEQTRLLDGATSAPEPACHRGSCLRRLWKKCFSSEPIREKRLQAAIDCFRVELNQRMQAGASHAKRASSIEGALKHLGSACNSLAKHDIDEGWTNLNAARRAVIMDYSDSELLNEAKALQHEAGKMTGWRAELAKSLLHAPDGKPPGHKALKQAAEILHEHYDNKYLKIALRRKSLKRLAWILLGLLGSVLLASATDWTLPAPLERGSMVWLVAIFGALGAAFSVALTLTSATVGKDIPDQMLGAFVTWMRPVIGAVSALIALVFIHAGFITGLDAKTPDMVILAIAFISGISERFVVNIATKKAGEDKD